MAKTYAALLASAMFVLNTSYARAADSGNAEVNVTIVFPATVDSFENLTVKAVLSQSTPSQTPGFTSYQGVDSQEIGKVSHTKGTESKELLTVGSKVKLDPNLKYMVMAQVLSNGKMKGIVRSGGKPNVSVPTGGGPSAVTFTAARILP